MYNCRTRTEYCSPNYSTSAQNRSKCETVALGPNTALLTFFYFLTLKEIHKVTGKLYGWLRECSLYYIISILKLQAGLAPSHSQLAPTVLTILMPGTLPQVTFYLIVVTVISDHKSCSIIANGPHSSSMVTIQSSMQLATDSQNIHERTLKL